MTRAARGHLLVDIRHVTGKNQALLENRCKLAVNPLLQSRPIFFFSSTIRALAILAVFASNFSRCKIAKNCYKYNPLTLSTMQMIPGSMHLKKARLKGFSKMVLYLVNKLVLVRLPRPLKYVLARLGILLWREGNRQTFAKSQSPS